MLDLQTMLPAHRRILCGGDWNCVQNMKADVLNGATTCTNAGFAEFEETARQLNLHELISMRNPDRNAVDLSTLTWASSPSARGIVQKRLDWFVADTDGADDVGEVTTIPQWMSLADGSSATDHATIVTEVTRCRHWDWTPTMTLNVCGNTSHQTHDS
jgi:hypothetical protein